MPRYKGPDSVSLQPPVAAEWPAESWTRPQRRQLLTWLRRFIPGEHGHADGLPYWWSDEDREADELIRALAARHFEELLRAREKPREQVPLSTDIQLRRYLARRRASRELRPRWTHKDEAQGLLAEIEHLVEARLRQALRRSRVALRLGFARDAQQAENKKATPFALPARLAIGLVTPEAQILRAALEGIEDVADVVERCTTARLRRQPLWGRCRYCETTWISTRPRSRSTCDRLDHMERTRKSESRERNPRPPSSSPERVRERVRRSREAKRESAKGAGR